jgi:hypothetical protein
VLFAFFFGSAFALNVVVCAAALVVFRCAPAVRPMVSARVLVALAWSRVAIVAANAVAHAAVAFTPVR